MILVGCNISNRSQRGAVTTAIKFVSKEVQFVAVNGKWHLHVASGALSLARFLLYIDINKYRWWHHTHYVDPQCPDDHDVPTKEIRNLSLLHPLAIYIFRYKLSGKSHFFIPHVAFSHLIWSSASDRNTHGKHKLIEDEIWPNTSRKWPGICHLSRSSQDHKTLIARKP